MLISPSIAPSLREVPLSKSVISWVRNTQDVSGCTMVSFVKTQKNKRTNWSSQVSRFFFCKFSQFIAGQSLSEALIFASINPHYDNRLSIESPLQYMKIPSSEHVVFTNCVFVLIFRTIYVHNMFWALNFYVLNWWFNGHYFVICLILWVSWGKNMCFWKLFSCIETIWYT